MRSQQQRPKEAILMHVCGKLWGHYGPALLPCVPQHQGWPSQGVQCICHALLQHADLSTDHRQQHHGSCLVIPWGAQYDHLLPEIMMPHDYQVLLVDLSTGVPFPLVQVGDFQLEDNIFPRTPGDSLLYTNEELVKL